MTTHFLRADLRRPLARKSSRRPTRSADVDVGESTMLERLHLPASCRRTTPQCPGCGAKATATTSSAGKPRSARIESAFPARSGGTDDCDLNPCWTDLLIAYRRKSRSPSCSAAGRSSHQGDVRGGHHPPPGPQENDAGSEASITSWSFSSSPFSSGKGRPGGHPGTGKPTKTIRGRHGPFSLECRALWPKGGEQVKAFARRPHRARRSEGGRRQRA